MTPGGHLSDADRLILAAGTGLRELTPDELEHVLRHVARAGFDPGAREEVRGRLAGVVWRGRTLRGKDMLPPAEVKYVWHVLTRREWPDGTSFDDYVDSIRQVVLDPASGAFVNRYLGAWGLGIVRVSRELRGPEGHDWLLVQYRVERHHWTTAFQLEDGLEELRKPQWSDIRWLRRPRHSNEP
jgi:hypothetical protein